MPWQGMQSGKCESFASECTPRRTPRAKREPNTENYNRAKGCNIQGKKKKQDLTRFLPKPLTYLGSKKQSFNARNDKETF